MSKDIKCVAFYLPQYHAIPENDNWWGPGFTEWTNVKAGQPLFEGHYQPKVPLDKNYYCLLDVDTLKWQAELAKKYGVYGFCYYHYWFKDGKKLLEKPAEIMLEHPEVDQNFCFCWANENWARTWDGGNNEVIMPQEYGGEKEWEDHLNYMLPFFKDNRYMKKDGSPILIIYRPDIIPNLNEMLVYWKKEIKNHGFKDLYVMSQHPSGYFSVRYDTSNISKFIMFEPQFTRTLFGGKTIEKTESKRKMIDSARGIHLDGIVNGVYEGMKKNKNSTTTPPTEAEKNDYDKYWEDIVARKMSDSRLVPGAFVDWDNIARKKNGMLFLNASPEKFEEYMKRLVAKCEDIGEEYIFINAWNEWGEGAYLEPDEKNGFRYLEAIKKALEE